MEEEKRVTSFVVCLTPLAKIFQPLYHKELKENPDLIFDDKMPFNVVAIKPSGAVHLEYRKPKLITDPSVLNWLTGGPEGLWSRETDYTGLVFAPVQNEAMEALTSLTAAFAEDPEKGAKMQEKFTKEITKKYSDKLAAAKQLSEARVMRTIKFVFENNQKQYRLNQEQGLGAYQPSNTEILCAFAYTQHNKSGDAKDRVIRAKFEEIMKDMKVV